jgi:exodeoxyribonuclease VIII
MKFGTLAHGVILEGQKYLDMFCVTPIFKGMTKDGKETTSMAAASVKQMHKEWVEALPPGAIIMTQEEHDKILFMIDSMLSHKFIQEVFKDGIAEYKKQWRDPMTGLKCVSSDDFVSFKNGLWADIKTTPSSDWYDFRKSVEKYNYPLQAAFYDQGIRAVHGNELPDKVWVTIESQPPWETAVHYISPYYMDAGNLMVKRALLDLNRCLKNDQWPQKQVIIEAGEPSFQFKSTYDQALAEESL